MLAYGASYSPFRGFKPAGKQQGNRENIVENVRKTGETREAIKVISS